MSVRPGIAARKTHDCWSWMSARVVGFIAQIGNFEQQRDEPNTSLSRYSMTVCVMCLKSLQLQLWFASTHVCLWIFDDFCPCCAGQTHIAGQPPLRRCAPLPRWPRRSVGSAQRRGARHTAGAPGNAWCHWRWLQCNYTDEWLINMVYTMINYTIHCNIL